MFTFVAISAISYAAESQPDAATLPDLRLDGSQITDETLSSLEGNDWGEIVLTNVRNNADTVERLRHARSIRSLSFSASDISGQIPRLSHVAGLKELHISGALSGHDLEAIGRLTELEKLSLPSGLTNALTINVIGAREIAQLIRLKSLKLYYVNIDDDAFKEFKTLTLLEELDISYTRVSDEGLKTIENMPRLKQLNLGKHQSIKQRFTNASVPIITKMTELESLSLSGRIGDQDLLRIVELPKLKSLDIYWTDVSMNGLDALSNSSIEHLVLSLHQIGAQGFDNRGVEALKKCKHLKHLLVIGKFWNEQHFNWLTKELPGVGVGFNA
jgi:NADPH-dependent 7-cyano-7-deazaguanine reductase QueF-like protein